VPAKERTSTEVVEASEVCKADTTGLGAETVLGIVGTSVMSPVLAMASCVWCVVGVDVGERVKIGTTTASKSVATARPLSLGQSVLVLSKLASPGSGGMSMASKVVGTDHGGYWLQSPIGSPSGPTKVVTGKGGYGSMSAEAVVKGCIITGNDIACSKVVGTDDVGDQATLDKDICKTEENFCVYVLIGFECCTRSVGSGDILVGTDRGG
jgi:hypothetical protein